MNDSEPATILAEACANMTWTVEALRFTLLGFGEPPGPEDFRLLTGDGPAQLIREGGETTLLVPASEADAVRARHPGAREEAGLCWVRFEAAMGWELVGFLALVTGRLAEAGVPLGAVCGFSRDHLFVAERYLETTEGILGGLFAAKE